jgi:hypothetical protein
VTAFGRVITLFLLLWETVLVPNRTQLANDTHDVESGDLDAARGFLAFVTLLVTFSVWFRKI